MYSGDDDGETAAFVSLIFRPDRSSRSWRSCLSWWSWRATSWTATHLFSETTFASSSASQVKTPHETMKTLSLQSSEVTGLVLLDFNFSKTVIWNDGLLFLRQFKTMKLALKRNLPLNTVRSCVKPLNSIIFFPLLQQWPYCAVILHCKHIFSFPLFPQERQQTPWWHYATARTTVLWQLV